MSLLLLGLPLPSSLCALRKYLFTFCTHLANPNLGWIHLSPCLGSLSANAGKKITQWTESSSVCLLSFSRHRAGLFLQRGIRNCQTGSSSKPCPPAHTFNCNYIICPLLPPASETGVPFSVESFHGLWSPPSHILWSSTSPPPPPPSQEHLNMFLSLYPWQPWHGPLILWSSVTGGYPCFPHLHPQTLASPKPACHCFSPSLPTHYSPSTVPIDLLHAVKSNGHSQSGSCLTLAAFDIVELTLSPWLPCHHTFFFCFPTSLFVPCLCPYCPVFLLTFDILWNSVLGILCFSLH